MGRRPKTLAELELSGSLSHNKGRYKHLLQPSSPSAAPMQTMQWRAPKEFNTLQKAAFREIVGSLPALVPEDRLLVELCAQLLAKQKAGTAKASESNRLLATLEKLRTRAERAARIAPAAPVSVAHLSKEDADLEEFFREEEAYQVREAAIRAEMERRRNLSPPENLTDIQAAQWAWYSTVADDYDKEHKHE